MFTKTECASGMFATPSFIQMRDVFDQLGASTARAVNNNKSKYDKNKDTGQTNYFLQNLQWLIGN